NNNPCGENICGKGNCVVSSNSTFGYECECDSGWKQVLADDDENLKFLPCVIPNCTLNNDCANALPPASDNHKNANFSFLDPCFWTYCGGGSCNKTSIFTHSCECDEGYFNLFNSTSFPCYKECALGLDCASLGLNMNNSTTSRPGSRQSSAEDSNSPGE
ncbi:latent-transforming growth factor beta-binding protein 2, partial [Striga asiatica]